MFHGKRHSSFYQTIIDSGNWGTPEEPIVPEKKYKVTPETEVKKKTYKGTGKARKMYETQDDLDKEDLFREELQNTFKCALDKLPISYGLDFLVSKGDNAVGVMEVKHRNNTHDKFDTVMLSLLKWTKGVNFAFHNGWVFSFAVRFTDGDYRYVHKAGDTFKIEYGGRTKQTRDSADIEPVVLIPITEFQKLLTKKL